MVVRFLALISFFVNVSTTTSILTQYKLHTVKMPLIGGPSFLRLHRALIFEEYSMCNTDNHACYIMDFLPVSPRDPRSAAILVCGGAVPGKLRLKSVVWNKLITPTVAPRTVSVDLEDIFNQLQSSFNPQLRLFKNDCSTFVKHAEQALELLSIKNI
jgi:hypothetical protein